jgi:hypothetical protein
LQQQYLIIGAQQMTGLVEWFLYQLKASADGFEWAFSRIPSSFREQLPPDPEYLGTWPPARHVWHVTEYERCLVIPNMYKWLNGPLVPESDWHDDDNTWAIVQDRGFDELIAKFRQARKQQIELLDQFTEKDWSSPRETFFGPKPLSWFVSKTFQHTYEHGDTLLRMGLWWEDALEDEARKSTNTGA